MSGEKMDFSSLISDELYRTFFEEAQDGISIADAETGIILECNDALAKLVGRKKSEIVGQPQAILHPPEETEGRFSKTFLEHRETKRWKSAETRVMTETGEIKYVQIDANMVKLEGRKLVQGIFHDITERKKVEATLQEVNQKLENIFENTHILIAHLDREFNFIQVNQAYATADNRLPDFFLGKNHFDLYPNDENKAVFREVVATGQPCFAYAKPFEYEYAKERGVGFWDWSLMPIKDVDGSVTSLILTMLEVTERKRAEGELQLQSAIMNNMAEGVNLVKVSDRSIVYTNPKFEEMFGYSQGELIGRDIAVVNAPSEKSPEEVANDIRQSLREKGVWSGEVQNIKKDGTPFWCRANVSTLEHSQYGQVWVSVQTDITERKQTEDALRKSEEQNRKVLETTSDGFWLVDTTGQILEVNDSCSKMSGYSREELLQMKIPDLEAKENAQDTAKHIQMIMEQGVGRFELMHRHKDGHLFHVDVSVQFLSGNGGKFFCFLRDITDKKQSEAALRRRAEEMTALQETVLGITSTVSLPELLQSIVEHATDLLDAMSGGLYLTEPEQQRVRCVVSYKTPKDFTGTTLAYGEGAAGYVAQTGEPLIIDDYRKWSGKAEVYKNEDSFQVVLSAPMIWQNEVIGVINVERRVEQKKFYQEELDLLTLFAAHAAVAVQNARLYVSLQESEGRFRSLYENSTVGIYRTAPDGTIHLANPALVEMLEFESVEELTTRDLNKDGFGPTYSRTSFIEAVEETGEIKGLEYPWLTKNGREIFVRESARAIRDAQGKTLYYDGIVEDITERRQAENRIRRHVTELEALYENGLAVSRLMEPGEIGQRIVDTFSQYLDWQHVSVRLWRGDSDTLTLIAFNQPGITAQAREQIGKEFSVKINRVGQGLSGHVIETGKPLRTGNVHDHPQYIETCPGIRSGMYMPLVVGGRIIGSIGVESEQDDAFSEQDERLLATLSAQAAVAFENAFLFDQTRIQLQNQVVLTEAGRIISSALDADKILASLAEQFGQAVDATSAYIVRYNPEEKEETVIAEYFSPNVSAKERTSDLGVSYSALHETKFEAHILSGQHHHSHRDDLGLTDENRAHMLEYGAKSILYIPLRVKDQLIGFVELWESREKREFVQEEIELCYSLSQQAALALENARLYQDTQQELQERKRVDAALRESEANLKEAQQIALMGSWHWDLQTNKILWSDEMYRIFGVKKGTVVNIKIVRHRIVPEDRPVYDKAFRSLETGGIPESIDYRIKHPDGDIRYLTTKARVVRDRSGKPTQLIGTVQDITERKQAEEELRIAKEKAEEGENQMRKLIEKSPLPMVMTDSNQDILFFNEKFTELFGYTLEDVSTAEEWWNHAYPDEKYRELVQNSWMEAIETSLVNNTDIEMQEWDLTIKDRTKRRCEFRMVPLRDISLIIVDDITERRQNEDKLKNLLREKEILLAEVHHRVKNNLQVVTSLLNLQTEGVEDERILAVLQESQNRIQSMTLVHEQLYRSKEYAHIDFSVYVDQLASTLFNMYEINPERIHLEVAAQDLNLDLDRAIPCGLLLNELITNSLKYAFPRGRKGRIQFRLSTENNKVTLEYGDDGVGLPEHIDFQNAHTLGLQLVQLLVTHDLHGSVTLTKERGTKFVVEFPISS